MPVVAIIGVDEAGKSTLIQQLKDKYPDKIDVLAFPTLPLREKLATLKIDYTDIHSILNYHMRFQLDFSEQQDKICQYIEDSDDYKEDGKLLILDRYIYCSLAYLRHAVLKHHPEDYWYDHIQPIFYGYYEYHIYEPNFVVWLKREGMDKEHEEIQDCYESELGDWDLLKSLLRGKWFSYEPIDALKSNTFERVEQLLLNKNYL